jgi:hypothetical protein
MMTRSRTLALALAVPLGLLALIQLVPYGRDHAAPPAGRPVAWDSPRTLALARRACFDCHSNETRWPWYSSFAPVSWKLQRHVDEGRGKLDFTAFDPSREPMAEAAGEAQESVTTGEMPPRDYLLMHPEARLTPAEKQELASGLAATFAAFAGHGEGGARAGAGRDHGERERHDERREGHGGDRD